MNNISEMNKSNCCGCSACENICPKGAISFINGLDTFLEPVIDFKKCINCGLCVKICPQLNRVKKNKIEEQKVYGVKNKSLNDRKKSSSGGMFSILANCIIDQNGIVYGASFSDDLKVEHIGVTEKEDLIKLQGSKYVQSNLKKIFSDINKNLKLNKKILFVGTPCQVAGLKSYLGKDYENLLLVDLVCHGVPSQKLFDKYVEWKEQKIGEKIEKFNFRDKTKTKWGSYVALIKTKNKNIYEGANENPYYRAFLKGDIFRETCYNCLYATEDRVSDITMADFWGCEDIYPKFADDYGVSAVLINSNKGLDIFNKIKDYIDYIETDIEIIKEKNHNLQKPTNRTDIRNESYKDIEDNSFEQIIKDNLKYNYTIIDRIKKYIPTSLKKKLKRITKRKKI